MQALTVEQAFGWGLGEGLRLLQRDPARFRLYAAWCRVREAKIARLLAETLRPVAMRALTAGGAG